ncbi:MAG TPA: hypothetical protein VD993_17025 [Chitinophagaceae bacterium]|nr:hypothetical protein [Chitinophagaceae bacterium]
MSKKGRIILAVILVAAAAGVYAWKEFNRKNKDLTNVKAEHTVQAAAWINEFIANDTSANAKYLGKVVSVQGLVKQVEKDEEGKYTVVLGDTADMSSVRCSMDSVHAHNATSLTRGQSVNIKGIYIDFNKDDMGLGSDVKMNRCVIVKN